MERRIATLALLALATLSHAAGANTVQVTTLAKLGTSASRFGLQVNLVDVAPRNAAFVTAGPGQGFNNEARLTASFFVDPQSVTMSTTEGLNSFQMIAFNDGVGAGSKTRLVFILKRTADQWFLNAFHFNEKTGAFQFSGGGFIACAALPCGNPANFRNTRLDFVWTAGNPGHLTLNRTRFVNGAPDASGTVAVFSVDLPSMSTAVVNNVFAGMFNDHKAGTSGQLFLDEFTFGR